MKGILKLKISKPKAVTMIELVVVVIIIAVLASIAIPQYTRSREKAMDKQAQAILSLIRAAERTYKMETGFYYPRTGSASGMTVNDISLISGNLSLDLVNDGRWGYAVSAPKDAPSFEAKLQRNAGGYDRTWEITSSTVNATCSGSSCQ